MLSRSARVFVRRAAAAQLRGANAVARAPRTLRAQASTSSAATVAGGPKMPALVAGGAAAVGLGVYSAVAGFGTDPAHAGASSGAGFPKFTTEHKSLMAKNLTEGLYNELSSKTDEGGFTLDQCINSGVVNKDSHVGIYAMHPSSYATFAKIFNAVIRDYHNYDPDSKSTKYTADLDASKVPAANPDPEGKYVVSTRIRVGRNLAGEPMSTGLSLERRLKVERKITNSLAGLTGDLAGNYYSLDGMKEEDRASLVRDHFLFKRGDRFLEAAGANRDWPSGRGIFHSADKKFLVWVNEEDQIRIISMQPGADIRTVFERLTRAIKTMSSSLEFGFDNKLGWLASCPSNLGTSMRASVHIKIPKFSKDPRFEAVCKELRVQVRGIHGEHSESVGGVYDISNMERLGVTEVDCANILHAAVLRLIAEEKKLGG